MNAGARSVAVVNLLVELTSLKHARQNRQRNCHQYNTHSSRVTKLVFGRSSTRTMLGTSRRSPDFRVRLGTGNTFPLFTHRRLRCLVQGTSILNPSIETFPFYEITHDYSSAQPI